MESNIRKIQVILNNLEKILSYYGYTSWAETLNKIRSEINTSPHIAAMKIQKLYGGMGSLSDIVLYADGKLLKQENDELDKFRHDLYILTKLLHALCNQPSKLTDSEDINGK